DKSGKGNDATIYGSAVVGGNLDLSGNTAAGFTTNGYATAPNGILNNLRSCTFMAKVKPASLASQPRIFDFGSASTNSILLRASAFTAGYKYNGGTTVLINSSASLAVGQESKVAMTFDAKTKTTKIYLNGLETASATTITYEPYQLTAIGANTRNYIGRTQWWDTTSAASNVDFNGTLDDFMLYDIALTAAEIAQVQSSTNTGIKELQKSALTIYPNPVLRNEGIQLSCNIGGDDMKGLKGEIINSLGETVEVIHPTASPLKINGINQSGIYLVRLVSGVNRIYTGKLLVK
ncbi:MAG TPA: LamG-like jellyroll fold domain-containing protein, partial [Paludibacter sp.]|nr:LamG-like jellyroll fold domain-containing protein [Paludibacter sp.]